MGAPALVDKQNFAIVSSMYIADEICKNKTMVDRDWLRDRVKKIHNIGMLC